MSSDWRIYFVGLLSAFSDVSTSWLCAKTPELRERNPLANPFLEATSVLGGQAAILHVGRKFKADPKTVTIVALVPPIVPFAAATNNLILFATVKAKYYPWKECPLLYSE